MENDEKRIESSQIDVNEGNRLDVNLIDDELVNLFAAFDEVGASDELQTATLERILGTQQPASDAVDSSTMQSTSPSNGLDDTIASSPTSPLSLDIASNAALRRQQQAPAERHIGGGASEARAVAGGNSIRAARQAKRRAIRVAAIAACLALALSGGVAYATPASYYEIAQGDSTVTLGVNCFGYTVSAAADNENGWQLIESTELCNRPYGESIERTIELMEERDPVQPVEYGPRGGEHEVAEPQHDLDGGDAGFGGGNAGEGVGGNAGAGSDVAGGVQPGEGQPGADRPGEGVPTGGEAPNDGRPQDDRQNAGANQPQGEGQPDGGQQGGDGGQPGEGTAQPGGGQR